MSMRVYFLILSGAFAAAKISLTSISLRLKIKAASALNLDFKPLRVSPNEHPIFVLRL
jgi:hypothetical protein